MKCNYMLSSRFVAAALLALLTCTPLRATMLIVVYTPDGYWIGADSARQAGGRRTETVCKVHETKFGLLLKAGNSQGTTTEGDVYSTDKEVEDLLAVSATAEEFKASLRLKFKQEIEAELIYILNDSTITPGMLGNSSMDSPIPDFLIPILTRSIFLFEPDTARWLGVALVVLPKSDPDPDPWTHTTRYRNWATSFLWWHPIVQAPSHSFNRETKTAISFPNSVKMLTYPVSYNKPDSWIQDHPKEALLEMLKLGHAEEPELIGPPFVIMHVSRENDHKQKTRWIQRGVCPSWDETVQPESFLREFRNP